MLCVRLGYMLCVRLKSGFSHLEVATMPRYVTRHSKLSTPTLLSENTKKMYTAVLLFNMS